MAGIFEQYVFAALAWADNIIIQAVADAMNLKIHVLNPVKVLQKLLLLKEQV